MLPKDLERLLVATFLKQGTDCLKARAKGQPVAGNGQFAEDPGALSRALDPGFEALGKATGLTERESRKKRAVVFEEAAHDIEELIGDRDTMMFEETARSLVETLREPYGIVITPKEAKAVILPLMNA
jgi:hypothetical protein